jgi:tRNA uridine 5-carbamoylmethylation protein Kti12
MNNSTTIINLFGGPGCGKSTLAAELFVALKKRGVSVELVREYAKELVWEGINIGPQNQREIFQEQARREDILIGKVQYLITDSPLFLSHIYHNLDNFKQNKPLDQTYINLVKNDDLNVYELNYIINRELPFETIGRVHNEEESKLIDHFIKEELSKNVRYYTILKGEDKIRQILDWLVCDL